MPILRVTEVLPSDQSMGLLTGDQAWRVAGLAMLSVRFIQGFVYWGGGSRRFIYAPAKIDPDAPNWMANKFQAAMPGALLGLDHVVAYILQHFWLLYAGVILFSAAELLVGLFLIVGLFTRAAALVSVGLSFVLMLIFGWQGATCIDEWTMAAGNFAMGATLALAGSGVYALDNVLLARNATLARRGWFRWLCGSLPLPMTTTGFRNLALVVFAATALFNVATYDYLRGSVFSAFHKAPVSPSTHHVALNDASIRPDGSLTFHAYLDAGSPDVAAHIVEIAVVDSKDQTIWRWDMKALSQLPKSAIVNDFAYNKFETAPFGLAAQLGAMATITLPGPIPAADQKGLTLVVTDVSGATFKVAVGQAVTGKASFGKDTGRD